MIVFAHRGCSGTYPENTMISFQHAEKTGCEGIENDVQLTKDGQMVIIHDEKIDRTSNGVGYVRDYTYQELLDFDFSAGFVGQYGKNAIPTMEEYLDWVKGTKLITNIELMNSVYYYEGMEEKVIAAVRERHLEDRIIFSSFNNVSIVKCKRLAPEIKAGFLAGQRLMNPGPYVSENKVDFYHPDQEWLTQDDVDTCKAHGVGINVWTCNTPKIMQRMENLGVNGIFTNFPEVAVQYYQKKQ